MACSVEGIQPEFVPSALCSDFDCDQLADILVNEAALDELWRAQGKYITLNMILHCGDVGELSHLKYLRLA